MTLRFRRPSAGDAPPAVAARHMGKTLEAFREALPGLMSRGFPGPDPTTGNFDLDAIEAWRRARNPQAYGLTAESQATNPRDSFSERLARFRG